MQNQTMNGHILLTVPVELMEEAGIKPYSLIQFYATEGKIVAEVVENTENFACDRDCLNCPCEEECEKREVD